MKEFIARNSVQTVRVRTPQREVLASAVALADGRTVDGADVHRGAGPAAEQIGDLAFDKAIRLHELAPTQASLEEAFMELTASSVEYQAGARGRAPACPRRAGEPVGSGEVA